MDARQRGRVYPVQPSQSQRLQSKYRRISVKQQCGGAYGAMGDAVAAICRCEQCKRPMGIRSNAQLSQLSRGFLRAAPSGFQSISSPPDRTSCKVLQSLPVRERGLKLNRKRAEMSGKRAEMERKKGRNGAEMSGKRAEMGRKWAGNGTEMGRISRADGGCPVARPPALPLPGLLPLPCLLRPSQPPGYSAGFVCRGGGAGGGLCRCGVRVLAGRGRGPRACHLCQLDECLAVRLRQSRARGEITRSTLP